MIIGSLLLLGAFAFPLWNITLEAPQYPIPLGMDIHIDRFEDTHEFDIQNINLMNHYVGMKDIPETIPEFKVFPLVIGIMVALGVIVGFIGKPKLYLAWFILICVLCAVGLYDFYMWEYDYGHNLDPKAIMNFKNPDGSVMGFQPPFIGSKDILNFTAHSYPLAGAYFLTSGILLTLDAFFVGRREVKKERKNSIIHQK